MQNDDSTNEMKWKSLNAHVWFGYMFFNKHFILKYHTERYANDR